MSTKYTRITITREAEQALSTMTSKINDGFNAGNITKTDLHSWIVNYFLKNHFENQAERIRRDHFNQITYLTAILDEMKKAKKSGTPITPLTDLLAPQKTQTRKKSDLNLFSEKQGSENIQNDKTEL